MDYCRAARFGAKYCSTSNLTPTARAHAGRRPRRAGPECDFAAGAPRGDAGNEKFINDPRTKALGDMSFDGRRMVFGGFETLLDS